MIARHDRDLVFSRSRMISRSNPRRSTQSKTYSPLSSANARIAPNGDSIQRANRQCTPFAADGAVPNSFAKASRNRLTIQIRERAGYQDVAPALTAASAEPMRRAVISVKRHAEIAPKLRLAVDGSIPCPQVALAQALRRTLLDQPAQLFHQGRHRAGGVHRLQRRQGRKPA